MPGFLQFFTGASGLPGRREQLRDGFWFPFGLGCDMEGAVPEWDYSTHIHTYMHTYMLTFVCEICIYVNIYIQIDR